MGIRDALIGRGFADCPNCSRTSFQCTLGSNKSIPSGPNSILFPAIKLLHVSQEASREESPREEVVDLITYLYLRIKKTCTCRSTAAETRDRPQYHSPVPRAQRAQPKLMGDFTFPHFDHFYLQYSS